MKRVLMTADAVGGVWTYALELARGLAEHGIQTILAVLGPPPDAARLAAARAIELHHRPYKLEWMDDPWDDVDRAGDWLLELERRLAPDVVHLNGYAHGALPFAAPKIVVAHSCVWSWWRAVHGEDPPPQWNEYRRRVQRGLDGASLIIAPTSAMRAAVHLHYGLRPILTIPNGLDPRPFRPAEKQPLVLTAGRFWDRAKNLQALDRIAPALAWPVYAAGDGAAPANAKSLGLLSAAAMRDWFARAAIYALPARYEPFGLSVLEAALSGCALVLGEIPSLRENWNSAALFSSNDDELRDALETLIGSATLRAKLQQAARDRATQFSAAKMTAAYLAAYEAARSHSAAALRSSTSP